jgi:hypothetical protein
MTMKGLGALCGFKTGEIGSPNRAPRGPRPIYRGIPI